MAVQEYEGVIINKLTLTKYKELKEANELIASQTYVIEDYLGEYTYICNGVNDNIKLYYLARKLLVGKYDYRNIKINIIGDLGVTSPYEGSGTTSDPYIWFQFNITTNRILHLDFSRCGEINVPVTTGYVHQIFDTYNTLITGANVIANNTASGTQIIMFGNSNSKLVCDNCRFWIYGDSSSMISNTGVFTNCRGSVCNNISNSSCFNVHSNSLLRLNGGEYYAYTADSSKFSAIVAQSNYTAVSVLDSVNAPTTPRTGYYQTNAIKHYGGYITCTGLISELPVATTSGNEAVIVTGTIPLSK